MCQNVAGCYTPRLNSYCLCGTRKNEVNVLNSGYQIVAEVSDPEVPIFKAIQFDIKAAIFLEQIAIEDA